MGKKNNIFFRQYSIRKKIGLVYGICIIPILIVLIMSVILIIRNVISKNIEILVTNNSGIIVKQIESKMQNAENCANIMLGYLNEIEFLREEYKSEISDLNKHNQVLKVMTYAYRVFTDVDGMVFVDQKGNVYGDVFRTIPNELEEAACVDGATIYQCFLSIIMPIIRPAIATVVIFNFLNIWNEFTMALILLSKEALKTLPLGLMFFQGSFTTDWGAMGAAMVVASIPTVVIYILFSNQVERAMTVGSAVK